MGKYKNLDGLRGLAALIVVFCHYSNAFVPSLHGWANLTSHTRYDQIFATTPLHLITGGDFAVAVFFVLSGFVLSNKFFKTRKIEVVISSAVRRYLRLMIPAAASVLLVWLVLKTGLLHSSLVEASEHGSLWMSHFWNFPANLFSAIYQGAYGIFFTDFNTYNPVLWTMHYELFGSFLVFLFLVLFGKLEKRWIFYLVLGVIFMKTYYLTFLLGVAISDMWTNRTVLVELIDRKVALLSLVLGLLLGGWYISSSYVGIYNHVSLPFFTSHELGIFAQSVGAALTMISVMRLTLLTKFFEAKPLQFLGRVSFGLYLTHFVILGSIVNIMYVSVADHLSKGLSVMIVSIAGIAMSLFVSWLFTILVDEKAIVISKAIGSWLLSDKPLYKGNKTARSDEKPTEEAPAPVPVMATAAISE